MNEGLWSRLTFRAEGPVVGSGATPVAEVVDRLEAGDSWDAILAATGLEPGDLVASVAADALGDVDSLGPPLIQARPRRPGLAAALAEPALPGKGGRQARLALAAGLLQVQDHWHASHTAAQTADDLGERASSAYWHGIGHRREPDPGNAAYWARRVGRHPIHAPLADLARPIRPGTWDPSAMIDLCTRARPGSADEALARRLQRLEMILLLNLSAEEAGLA